MAVCSSCGEETYRYRVLSGRDVCMACVNEPTRAQLATCFPFVTCHVDGKPMEIKSLKHYRQVCRERGTVPIAFEMDAKNTNSQTMIEMGDRARERNIERQRQGFEQAKREIYQSLYQKFGTDTIVSGRR